MAKAKTWTVHGAPSQAAMTEHTTAKFTTTTSNNKNEEESQHTLDHQVPSEGIAQEEETVFSSLRYPLISRQQLRRRARIAQEEVMPFGYRSNDEDQDTQGPTDSNGGSAGFPLEYSCRRQVTGIPTSTLFVIYDYEYVADSATEDFAASDTSTTPTTLPAVEWGTLWRVADQMGLHECSFTKQQIPTNNRKLAVDENSTNIVTLSSAPVDNFDPLVAGQCQFLNLVHPNDPCYAMRGNMTVEYTGQDPKAVETYLRAAIAKELDMQQALTTGIEQTLYLGNRSDFLVSASPPQTPVGGPGAPPPPVQLTPDNTRTIALTTVLSATVVMFLVLVGFFVTRNRRRTAATPDEEDLEKASTQESSPRSSPDDEISTNPVFESYSSHPGKAPTQISFQGRPGPDAPDSKPSPDSPAHSATTIRARSIGSSTTIHMSNRRPTTPDTTESLSIISSDTASAASDDAVRAASANRSTDGKDSVKMVDVLPPLPPNMRGSKAGAVPPAAVKPPQRRRRRKKKKKGKRTVKRVNSRDSVKEMETIAEGEEEYDSGDDGSEYSWYSEESEGSRSRDPSPARSTDMSGESSLNASHLSGASPNQSA